VDNKQLYDLAITWLTALGVCAAFGLVKTRWVRLLFIALTLSVASLGSVAKVSPTNLWEAIITPPRASLNGAPSALSTPIPTPAALAEANRQKPEHREDQHRELKALVVRTQMDPARINVVLACDTGALPTAIAAEAESKLANSLQKLSDRAAIYRGVLRPEFMKDGYFDRAFGGDFAFLADTGLFDSAHFLVLCRVNARASPNSAVDGLFSSSTEVEYRIIRHNSEELESGSIHAVGPGASAEAAVMRGVELAVERNESTFKRFLDPPVTLRNN
jgi:hypothetical protein